MRVSKEIIKSLIGKQKFAAQKKRHGYLYSSQLMPSVVQEMTQAKKENKVDQVRSELSNSNGEQIGSYQSSLNNESAHNVSSIG